MAGSRVYVALDIAASADRVWALSQDFSCHARWDLRFTRIIAAGEGVDGEQRFTYERSVGPHAIRGIGISSGGLDAEGPGRVSALRFSTDDRVSPIRRGSGYWRYIPSENVVTFITGHSYDPGWGTFLDRVLMHRLIGWMTAWSFDRLRIWAEDGIEPERWPLRSVLYVWKPARPRAKRTTRRRQGTGVGNGEPAGLRTLGQP
jgi:hypothetical protein